MTNGEVLKLIKELCKSQIILTINLEFIISFLTKLSQYLSLSVSIAHQINLCRFIFIFHGEKKMILNYREKCES